MNVLKYARNYKKKIEDLVDEKKQRLVVKEASKLAELKKRRIALEGRDKILAIRDQEKARIKQAKEKLRKKTTAYKVIKAIQKHAKNVKKEKSFGKLEPGTMFR
jgi:hypothetical protein